VADEVLKLQLKRTLLSETTSQKLRQIIDLQDRQQLVETYARECDSIKDNLNRLGNQVNHICNGNIGALKKQISQLKFIPNVDQKFKNQIKRRKNVFDTGYPSNSPSHRKLLNSCSNKKNRNVIKLIHASERVKFNEIKQKIAVDKLLERVELDRNLIIKEKMKCIWGEQSVPIVN